MVAALALIRSEKEETVMQSSIISPVRISPVRNQERSLGLRRGNVHKFHRKLDRVSRWEDEVASVSLALLVAILFALVYQAIVV
jgi:hypothetical protein